MSRIASRVLLLSPAILGAFLFTSPVGITAESQKEITDIQSQVTEIEVIESPPPEHLDDSIPSPGQEKDSLQNGIQEVESELSRQSAIAPMTAQTKTEQLVIEIEESTQLAKTANKSVSTNSSVSTVQTKQSFELADNYTNENNENDLMNQVTNVTQLSDVKPSDWAYEALRSLVERYGCIAGYPDRTYRGNQSLTRFEFAAGLNACLNQIERLIASSTADFVRRSDLEMLQRLVNEFRTELTTLGTRVDRLEGRVGFLENHQFSTTTKLNGEVIFALSDLFGDRDRNGNKYAGQETVLQDRVRLNLDTSFTGKDRLRTRLQAGNITEFGPLRSITGNNPPGSNITREG